nr:MAG TPA: hypothetical protein [Caudoviricetes sp.]
MALVPPDCWSVKPAGSPKIKGVFLYLAACA